MNNNVEGVCTECGGTLNRPAPKFKYGEKFYRIIMTPYQPLPFEICTETIKEEIWDKESGQYEYRFHTGVLSLLPIAEKNLLKVKELGQYKPSKDSPTYYTLAGLFQIDFQAFLADWHFRQTKKLNKAFSDSIEYVEKFFNTQEKENATI